MSEQLPNRDLIEASQEFPGAYTFKVIGVADPEFVSRVLRAVKLCLDESAEPAFSSRSTPSGRHFSVTIVPDVRDADHVLEIYQQLRGLDGVVMLL